MNKTQLSKRSLIFFLLLLFAFLALMIFIIMNIRVDKFSELLKMEKSLPILLIVTDEDDRPVLTTVFFYNPNTKKSALFNIPEYTGTIITDSMGERVDRIDSLFRIDNPHLYMEKINEIMDINIDFYLIIPKESLSSSIDIVRGINVFIPREIRQLDGPERILLPPGSVVLDGAKAYQFLTYKSDDEPFEDIVQREHQFLQAYFKSLGQNYMLVSKDDISDFLYQGVITDLDRKSYRSLLYEISKIDYDRMIFQTVRGTVRSVDDKELLFPFHDGQILLETVNQIEDILARSDVSMQGDLVINLEILNGTTTNGMASRTAQVFRSYGFSIATVSNADRDDYERTVVIDRKGNPEAAQKAADLINCTRIHTDIYQSGDETIDVTIILGKDFDGRYVK